MSSQSLPEIQSSYVATLARIGELLLMVEASEKEVALLKLKKAELEVQWQKSQPAVANPPVSTSDAKSE